MTIRADKNLKAELRVILTVWAEPRKKCVNRDILPKKLHKGRYFTKERVNRDILPKKTHTCCQILGCASAPLRVGTRGQTLCQNNRQLIGMSLIGLARQGTNRQQFPAQDQLM